MRDWTRDRLGNHAEIRARIGWRGLSADEYVGRGPFLIAAKHIVSGAVDWVACDNLTEHRYRESPEIALQVGDVIVSKDGTIGRVARLDSLPGPATLNGTMMLVRSAVSLDYRYLSHLLRGSSFKKLVEERISGSSVPHVFQRDLSDLPVDLPPLEEQRRIAEILDTIDETIRATERVITKRKRIRAGLAVSLLTGRSVEATDESERSRASRLCEVVDQVTTKVHGCKPSGRRYVGLEHIESEARTLIGTAPSSYSQGTNGLFEEGDVLFGKLRPNLRKAVQADFGGYCSTDLLVLRPKESVDTRYAGYIATSESVFRHAEVNSIGTRMPRTSWSAVSQARVWLPPLAEQRRIAAILDTIGDTIRANEQQCDKLRQLRSGLAADLLSGRVRTVAV